MKTLICTLWIFASLCHAQTENATAEIQTAAKQEGREGWAEDYETARQQAMKSGLVIVLYFTGSDWSQRCRQLDSQVFANPLWAEHIRDRFVMVAIDLPRDRTVLSSAQLKSNVALAQQYEIENPPAFVMLTPDTKTVVKKFTPPAEINLYSTMALFGAAHRYAPGIIEAFAAKLDTQRGKDYISFHNSLEKAHAQLREWLATNPQPTPENLERMALESGQIRMLTKRVERIELDQVLWELAGNKSVYLKQHKLLQRTRQHIRMVEDMQKAESDLSQWVQGRPTATESNRVIYTDLLERVKDTWRAIAEAQGQSLH